MTNTAGIMLVNLYYRVSPPLARLISEHDTLKTVVRELVIEPLVKVVDATREVWDESPN